MDIAKKKKASIRSGKKKAGPGYKSKIKMKKAKSDYYDFNLVAVIILIMCFGLIMLYSTSSYMAQINEGDDMFYFKKQAMYSIGCLVLAIIVSYFDYHILAKFPFVIYVVAAVLMVLVKTPLGVTSHGARRWLKLGVQFQPAEIAKIAVIITLSYLIVKMGKRVETLKATMVLLGMGGIQALFAYVFTDNLSTAMIILGITVGLVFIAHPKTKPFVILAVVAVILVAILVFFAAKGLAKGFVYTCLHTLGWIAAIVLAWFAAKPLADILEDGSLGMSIRDSLTEKFAMSTAALDNAVAGMPTIISGGISAGAGEASDLFVQLLTTTIVTLISFLAITVGCSILMRILVHPACKRQHRGLLHTSDRVMGLLTGLVEGVLLVFLFLALLMVVVNCGGEGLAGSIVDSLDSSFIAGALYDSNLLLIVTGVFFS